MLRDRKISDITYVRSIVESSHNKLGSLPGDVSEKFDAYTFPLKEKLEELIYCPITRSKLFSEELITVSPVNFLRGRNFGPDRLVCIDEAQNFTYDELVTTITRIGENCRIWFLGDPKQIDLHKSCESGFPKFMNIFDDEESREFGIRVFRFEKEDIIRSRFCQFVVEKLNLY